MEWTPSRSRTWGYYSSSTSRWGWTSRRLPFTQSQRGARGPGFGLVSQSSLHRRARRWDWELGSSRGGPKRGPETDSGLELGPCTGQGVGEDGRTTTVLPVAPRVASPPRTLSVPRPPVVNQGSDHGSGRPME